MPIENKAFLCRVSRDVTLFDGPDDVTPTGSKLRAGTKFYSYHQYSNGGTVKYLVSEKVDIDVPIGEWCPENVISTIPVDIQTTDTPTVTKKKTLNSPLRSSSTEPYKAYLGADTATKISSSNISSLTNNGIKFIGRYLPIGHSSSREMTTDEVSVLSEAGITIMNIFETHGLYPGYETISKNLGTMHGTDAKAAAQAIGAPTTSCIFFSCVANLTDDELADLVEYIRAAKIACGPYPCGLFAPRDVINYVAAHTSRVVTAYWQRWDGTSNISPNTTVMQGSPMTDFITVGANLSGLSVHMNGAASISPGWSDGNSGSGTVVTYPDPKSNTTIVNIYGEEVDVTGLAQTNADVSPIVGGAIIASNAISATAGFIRDGVQMVADVASTVWDATKTVGSVVLSPVALAYNAVSNAWKWTAGEVVTAAEILGITLSPTTEDPWAEYGDGYRTPDAYSSGIQGNIPIGNMAFVHGLPFQYTEITDRRNKLGGEDFYGRSYARDILANLPIMIVTPGKPVFMTNVTNGTTLNLASVAQAVGSGIGAVVDFLAPSLNDGIDAASAVLNGDAEALSDMNGDYQYYSLQVDTTGYFNYVDSMCKTAASIMGLGRRSIDGSGHGTDCINVNWADYNKDVQFNSMFQDVMGMDGGVSFVFDPTGSVSDTISNSTTDSQFAGMFSEYSSKAREMEFILGYSGSSAYNVVNSSDFTEEATNSLKSGGMLGIENVVDRIGTWIKNTAHGMNIRFPEIWADSTNQRSYDVEMHFIAPYCTDFCKWRYVLVPFFHTFALAAPKSNTNSSQYSAPFIIRAFSVGYFNVELGIVESLTWKRFGEGDMISSSGIPTQIDVTMSFKDLYHTLMMTNMFGTTDDGSHMPPFDNINAFMRNTGLMDMIGTLSGVNMNRINFAQRVSLKIDLLKTTPSHKLNNWANRISDRVRILTEKLYGVG